MVADQSFPIKGAAYTLRTTLVSQADTDIMQDPPTLAAGDVQVSTDGSALANTTNAPTTNPAGSKIAEVILPAAEMNGDIVVVTWHDVAGAQWQDQTWVLHPTARTIQTFPAGSIEFTYTLTNSVSGLPIDAADVWVSTDLAGTNVVWRGVTDSFGVARDANNEKPWLDAGTYYFFRQRVGFSFTNPDTEVVS